MASDLHLRVASMVRMVDHANRQPAQPILYRAENLEVDVEVPVLFVVVFAHGTFSEIGSGVRARG